MLISSHKLSNLVAESVYVNIYLKNTFSYTENANSSGVRYPTNIKSTGFRSKLEASRMSSHTEELCYNKNSQSVDNNIYAPPLWVEHFSELLPATTYV